MAEPDMLQAGLHVLAVEAGKPDLWKSRRTSSNRPFSDPNVKGAGSRPILYKAERAGTVCFCDCKRSAGALLYDNTRQTR